VKLTLKLILILSLFSSAALADEGDMTGGGKSCSQGQPTCRPADPVPDTTDTDSTDTDSILIIVQKYLASIFE
jgi:hypothetical protein